MRNERRAWWLAGALVVGLIASGTPVTAAEEVAAEVRTWDGAVFQLSQVSLETFYTIMPRPKEGESAGGKAPDPGASGPRAQLFGSLESLSQFFDKQGEPLQAHRHVESVTLARGSSEISVPLANIRNLRFERAAIVGSQLPPYVARSHYRYSATAVLTDGSMIQADNVALGTTRVRGVTPQGRLDLPWDAVESISFRR